MAGLSALRGEGLPILNWLSLQRTCVFRSDFPPTHTLLFTSPQRGEPELCALPRGSRWKAETPTLGLSDYPNRLQVPVDILMRQGLLHVRVFLVPITRRPAAPTVQRSCFNCPWVLIAQQLLWMTNQCEWPLRKDPTGEQALCSGMRSQAMLMSISAYYPVRWDGVALTWECLPHVPPLPSFCFYLKHAGKFQWVLKALWAVDLDFNFVGQEGVHQWLWAPKQSYHVYQLLGSLVTSGAEKGKKCVTFPLFVPRIWGRIKSLGSHLPLLFSSILASFLLGGHRIPKLFFVLCSYVCACIWLHFTCAG